jgi:hypothetical protein
MKVDSEIQRVGHIGKILFSYACFLSLRKSRQRFLKVIFILLFEIYYHMVKKDIFMSLCSVISLLLIKGVSGINDTKVLCVCMSTEICFVIFVISFDMMLSVVRQPTATDRKISDCR